MSDFDTSYAFEPLANAITADAVQQGARLAAAGGLGVSVPIGSVGTMPGTDDDDDGNDMNTWYFAVDLDGVDVVGPTVQ